MHDKLGLSQELLELAHIICFFGSLIEAIPWSSERLGSSSLIGEVSLDDVFNLVNPSLFKVVRDLTGAGLLNLPEFIDSHRFCNIWIVNIFLKNIIALFSNLLHGSD